MDTIIIVAAIGAIASLIGSVLVFVLGWKKSNTEAKKLDADTGSSEAQASETWAQSNQLAAQQIVDLQRNLGEERKSRIELEKKVTCLELKLDKQDNRIKRLEAQIISLGSEPVK